MKVNAVHRQYGEILYEESAWSGKRSIFFQGVPLKKCSKTDFELTESGTSVSVRVRGNVFTGISLVIDGDDFPLTPATKWYEMVLSALIFAVPLVWGNNIVLVRIVPVVGGAIGGAVSGVFAVANLLMIKGIKPVVLKVLVSLAMLGAAFAVCFAIGTLILNM